MSRKLYAFREEIQAIVNANLPDRDEEVMAARGTSVRTRRSSQTLMSSDVVEELLKDVDATAKAGVLEMGSLLVRAGKILKAREKA